MPGLERGSAGRARSPAQETPKVALNAGQLKDLPAVLIPSGNMVRSRFKSAQTPVLSRVPISAKKRLLSTAHGNERSRPFTTPRGCTATS